MRGLGPAVAMIALSAFPNPAAGQQAAPIGPYNATFLSGGIGIERTLDASPELFRTAAPFSFTLWVHPHVARDRTILFGIGGQGSCRCLMLGDGRLEWLQSGSVVAAGGAVPVGRWSHVAVTSDGRTVLLFVDGKIVAKGAATATATASAPLLSIAPNWSGYAHFGGHMVEARLWIRALAATDIRDQAGLRPDFDLVHMWQVGVGWEWQSKAQTGLWRPQDPWTLPMSRTAFTPPVAKPIAGRPALTPLATGRWTIGGWRLAAAPDVPESGATLSRAGFDFNRWLPATVPGTVLQTYVDRGVYPDPYYGLNNLRIPERLARQDYWYMTRFALPPEAAGRRLALSFGGINYASEVWVNGRRLGTTRGAFIRGRFDFAPAAGTNVVAVRVSPPPHPGIPHEQSMKAGVGENGGQLAIDGPTFVATEGWDWIPGIRDRNTGIWQPVELQASGDVRILDPQIVTDLPLPRTDRADILVTVPVYNAAEAARSTVRIAFDGVTAEKTIDLPPGRSDVRFTPSEFRQLSIAAPALWWPNGYGDPVLHTMRIEVGDARSVSDVRTERFGIREVSYDLSLFDSAGALRRVNVQTTDGALDGVKLIDVRHEAIKQTPTGWAESLTAAGERSKAVLSVAETLPEPHLTLRVNGVRIAARGGNWGMDDAMKRVSRARLEPYFRLQREAHMNVIRNWMGNNNEDEFYDLADENGMMVLNDFWQSTQNFQVEPQDPQLFLENARDTVARYRNHPSIVLWFGRNEGVPYPVLNEGLEDVVFKLDGTRWFTGSSNTVNLQGSGPYNYRSPVGYFTDLASGFSVETGTPSLSTRESIESYVPKPDLWPLSDTLAYHDWHFGGNGDTKTFMAALDTMFGAPSDFADFERKAQMMNLETHKAMYEGFLGHLWTKNSGRLLWMSHPAWPSNAWQLYSSDYDTSAAYFGAKKAAEPLHVQLNLPDNRLMVLNTTRDDRRSLRVRSRVLALDGRELLSREDSVDALANRATPLPAVPLDTLYDKDPMLLVKLELLERSGRVLADNFYWRGKTSASYRALNDLRSAALTTVATPVTASGTERAMRVRLANTDRTPALNIKLTLVDAAGKRVLPAFYSDNYVALLPGESRAIEIRYPAVFPATRVTLRGWNVAEQSITTGSDNRGSEEK